jgi:hypothetical protein
MTSDIGGISPEALARALFERLVPLVPREFEFTRNGARMRLIDPRGAWSEMDCPSFFESDPEAPVDAAERASYSVLSHVQDFVSEFLTEPWPEPSPESYGLAPPGVVVTDDGLRLLYGTPSDPLLELPLVQWTELHG